jgi:cysteine-rich repeat protein
MRRSLVALLMVVASACGSKPLAPEAGAADGGLDSGPSADGGSSFDAGPEDGGSEVDGGSAIDAGIESDGGSEIDGGSVTDAGPGIDGGTENDAGAVDGGTEADAGLSDAGSAADAGSVDAGVPDAGADAGPSQVCGDGVVERTEQCDLGELNGTGQGCNSECMFDCQTSADCTNANVCVGAATCVPAAVMNETVQLCQPGPAVSQCTACPTGFCDGLGQCDVSTCGDGCVDVSAGEQCDFGAGNNVQGSGCNSNCQFSCTTSPNSCDDGNPCNGLETCQAVTGPNGDQGQACAAGTPPLNGTTCGMGLVCENGACTTRPEVCGDGIIEAPEQCDLGSANGTGQGCTSTCTFDCETNSDCSNSHVCVGTATCVHATVMNETVQLCQAGTDAAQCTTCSSGFCDGTGQCNPSTCGDGCVDPSLGEQCDFGAGNNLPGSGCEPDCQFSCTTSPDSCDNSNACAAPATCADDTGPNGGTGQACSVGTAPPNGAMCGTGFDFCSDGTCTTPVCGNGILEPGEQCDLGSQNGTGVGCTSTCQFDCETDADCGSLENGCNGTATCAASTVDSQTVMTCVAGTSAAQCSTCTGGFCNGAGQCHPSVCGDGCIDPSIGEQCDDGNLFNLDGCDSHCQYEVVTRMTSIAISGSTAPSFCTPTTNRLGKQSLTSTALSEINSPLQTDVTNGSVNIMTQLLGLSDLTGNTASGPFSIGVMGGSLDPAKGTWPGNNPIDWWFLADDTTVNSSGLPTSLMTASLTDYNLTAGPNDVSLTLVLGGSPAILEMRSTKMAAQIQTPTDVPAPPPAALAASLAVYETVNANGTDQGLCGNITVSSLAQIPVPSALTSGTTACTSSCSGSRTYTACGSGGVSSGCNSLLDVLVGGCKVVWPLCIAAINAEQPDVPATAGGTVKTLTFLGDAIPTSQTSADDDAYSSYMTFQANRAHFTGETCSQTSDCQTGKTCVSKTCQ